MKDYKRPILYILLSALLFTLFYGISDFLMRDAYSVKSVFMDGFAVSDLGRRFAGVSSRSVAASAGIDDLRLIPGGNSFGVKIYADGLICVGFADVEEAEGSKTPALDAGMKLHDIVTKADGAAVTTAEDFVKYVEEGGGRDIELEFRRGDKTMKATVRPVKSGKDGKYRIGMWLRDSTAGIGTVTFVMPESLYFGGLGHGICDSASGELVPLSRGSIADVEISSVVRGTAGTPGELKGSFSSGRRGALVSNTDNGVFGAYSSMPEALAGRESLPVCGRDEICEGDAVIYCTLGDDGICEYGVKISDIDRGDMSSKSFVVTVTDERLIERTGGIVQGMSGSPIVQNGKIIGAVTHVLISDPTKGYGIFIENMLDAME